MSAQRILKPKVVYNRDYWKQLEGTKLIKVWHMLVEDYTASSNFRERYFLSNVKHREKLPAIYQIEICCWNVGEIFAV